MNIAALTVAGSVASASELNEITIDNAPFEAVEGPIVLPVVAVRPIAGIHPVAAANLHEINFSKDLMVESARQFPEIAKALETAGYDPNDPTWDQLKTVVEMSGYKERHLYGGTEAHYEPRIVRSELAAQEFRLWDATTIMNLWSTGAFDSSTITQHRRGGGEIVETIRFREPYGHMVSGIYSKLSLIKYRPAEEASMWFAAVQDDITQYDLMQQSLLAEIREITFGTPIIYPAEEEELTVPPSLSRNFDVYWARFNVSSGV